MQDKLATSPAPRHSGDVVEREVVVDAEECVLSAMLMDVSAIEEVRARDLRADDFNDRKRASVFRAMLALHDRGSAVDPILLASELNGTFDAAGGKDYIGYLIDVVSTASNVRYHAELVLRNAKSRGLADKLEENARALRDGTVLAGDVAARLRPALDILSADGLARESRFRLLTDLDLESLPEATALVDGSPPIVFCDSLAALIGKYGTYKTFLLLEMAFCIAIGADWHGHRVHQGAVIYIYAEGAWGARARVAALKKAYGYTGSAPIYFIPTSVLLTEPAQVALLLGMIRALGIKPVAVVVDTVARNSSGNENDVEAMGRFIRGCDTIREATGATVFLAHHTGWAADRSRGSTSLPGAVSTEILVERDDDIVTLKCTKQKDAAEFAPITLEAFQIAGSLAFRTVVPGRAELTRNERTALTVVQANEPLTSSDWMENSGLAKGSFHNARKRLITLVYVKRSKNKYAPTDAGRLALGTTVKRGTTQVQAGESAEVQTTLMSRDMSGVPDRSTLEVGEEAA